MSLLAGFKSIDFIYLGRAKDRNTLYIFFQELSDYLERKSVSHKELITDRLYRRYVRFNDVEETLEIMSKIEEDFISEDKENREVYRDLFSAFYDGVDNFRYSIENNIATKNRLQAGLLELPYELEEQLLPNEYYDDLPDDAEPVWMRTEALDVEGILEKYRTKK